MLLTPWVKDEDFFGFPVVGEEAVDCAAEAEGCLRKGEFFVGVCVGFGAGFLCRAVWG